MIHMTQPDDDQREEFDELFDALCMPIISLEDCSEQLLQIGSLIESDNEEQRTAAVATCGLLIHGYSDHKVDLPASVIDCLQRALNDDSPQVRHAVVNALQQYQPVKEAARLVPGLETLLDDPAIAAETREIAIEVLAGLESRRAIEALLLRLSSAGRSVREHAADHLSRSQSGSVPDSPALRNALVDTSSTVRLHAAQTLWKATGDAVPVVPVLRDVLNSSRSKDVVEAARVLLRIGPPASVAVPDLLALHRSPHYFIRVQSVRAIMTFDCGPKGQEILLKLRADPDQSVRMFVDMAFELQDADE